MDRGPHLSQLISGEQLIGPLHRLDRRAAVALLHLPAVPQHRQTILPRTNQQTGQRSEWQTSKCSHFSQLLDCGRHGETATRQSAFLLRSCCASLLQKRSTEGKHPGSKHSNPSLGLTKFCIVILLQS